MVHTTIPSNLTVVVYFLLINLDECPHIVGRDDPHHVRRPRISREQGRRGQVHSAGQEEWTTAPHPSPGARSEGLGSRHQQLYCNSGPPGR